MMLAPHDATKDLNLEPPNPVRIVEEDSLPIEIKSEV